MRRHGVTREERESMRDLKRHNCDKHMSSMHVKLMSDSMLNMIT